MKKFLLSILCLFSIVAMQAQNTYTYDFSSNKNWVTEAGGSTNVGTSSSNKLNAFYYAETGDVFNANGTGYFNSGYFLWGKSGAYIELPTFDGEVITNVTAHSSTGHSKKVTVNVYTAAGDAASTELLWETQSSDYSYDIAPEAQSSVLRLQVTNGYNSQVASITITTQAASNGATLSLPTATVAQGTIYNPVDVELNAEQGTIYYTIDGTNPTTESSVYNGAISVSEFGATTTIKAIAIDGEEYSNVATFNYTLKVANPVMSHQKGVYTRIDDFAITSDTEAAEIKYARITKYSYDKNPNLKTADKWFSETTMLIATTTEVRAIAYVLVNPTAEVPDTVWSDVTSVDYYISPIAPFKAANEIVSGTKYLIGCGDIIADYIYKTNTYSYLYDLPVTVNGEYIETNEFYGYTFTESETAGEYYIQDAFERYLYMDGEHTSFQVAAELGEIGDAALWTVEFDDDLTATIANKGFGNVIEFSSKYGSFGAYETTTGEKPILYGQTKYPTFTVTPSDWETIEAFSTVVVECEQGLALNETEELYASVTDPSGTQYALPGTLSDDATSITFKRKIALDANGSYTVTFPEGLFTMDPNGLSTENQSSKYYYTVENNNVLEVVWQTPQNNANLTSIEYLKFDFNQDIVDNVSGAALVDGNGNSYPLTSVYEDEYGSIEYYTLCLKTEAPITTPGTYTFVLKRDYASSVENPNVKISNDITFTYNIIDPIKIVGTTPENGSTVESFKDIIIECSKNLICRAEAFYMIDDAGNAFFLQYAYDDGAGNELPLNKVRLYLNEEITTNGNYTIYIESGNIISEADSMNWMNPESVAAQTITFAIVNTTGINNVAADNEGENVIYDLTGRRIDTITAPGIYIINGVKTIVK